MRTYIERLDEATARIARFMALRGLGAQLIVLRTLRRVRSASVSDLAACLGVTPAAATAMVDRLVGAGLASRERDGADRRIVRVRLTPEGEAALARLEAARRQALLDIYGRLSEGELATLVQILEKAVESLA